MDASVVDEVLTPFTTFSARDTLTDYNQGKADAQREMPDSAQATFSAYELLRISEARTSLNRYIRRLREVTDRIDSTVVERELERQTEYIGRIDSLGREKAASLAMMKQVKGPASRDWSRREAVVTERQRTYQEEEFRAGRTPQLSLHESVFRKSGMPWKLVTPYVTALFILALFEIPINELAVRLAFEFSEFMSYVVALFIGISFVLLAHFTGLQLRHAIGGPTKESVWRKALRLLSITAVISLAAIMIYVLFQMRGQVAGLVGNTATAKDFVRSVASAAVAAPQVSFWRAVLKGLLAILPWTSDSTDNVRYAQFGFLMLNVMVFGSGVVLSFYRHDSDPSLERAWQRMHSAEQELFSLQVLYDNEVADLEHRFTQRIISRQNRADLIKAEIERLNQEKQRLLRQADSDMRVVLDVLIQQISAYQQGNTESRRSRIPPYFGHSGLLHLGETLLIQS